MIRPFAGIQCFLAFLLRWALLLEFNLIYFKVNKGQKEKLSELCDKIIYQATRSRVNSSSEEAL